MNDDEMREAFRGLAAQDARAVGSFSRTRVEAQRPSVRARRRRVWFMASGLTLAAAAALMFAVMPRQELLELDLTGTRLTPATDFLLNTPGSSLLRSVPSIGITTTSRRPAAPSPRGDTSRRDQ